MDAEEKKAVQQWTAEEAKRVLGEWRLSGKTLTAFARDRGYTGFRLRYWRQKLGETSKGKSRPGRIRLVPMVPKVVVTSGPVVVVHAPKGVVLELAEPTKVPASWLAEVVHALASPLP